MKSGWTICGHCQGNGVCNHKLIDIKMLYGFIPLPIKASCDSCVAAIGGNPLENVMLVQCNSCKGKGYVYLDPSGDRKLQPPQQRKE